MRDRRGRTETVILYTLKYLLYFTTSFVTQCNAKSVTRLSPVCENAPSYYIFLFSPTTVRAQIEPTKSFNIYFNFK